MRLMSTSASGWVSRKLSSGIRLWPPARTLARSPWSARIVSASSSARGAKYSNRGGFMARSWQTSVSRHGVLLSVGHDWYSADEGGVKREVAVAPGAYRDRWGDRR